DHRDGQRFEHFRAGAETQGEGEHARDGGQSGHGDGPQAAAARLNHRLFRGKPEPAESLIGVEKKNAVFSDDADHHDDAHERGNVERGAGGEQGKQRTESGKQRGSKDGGGRREAAKFKKQDNEEQQQRQNQNLEQVAERFLLLPVGAAVLHTNRRGQMKFADGLLYRGDAGTETHSFKTRRHLHEALGI